MRNSELFKIPPNYFRPAYAILHGEISSELTDDPRGIRFVVLGNATDNTRSMEVVCRFLPTDLLRIITVYQIGE